MKRFYFLLLLAVSSCAVIHEPKRETIDLAGRWQFALDTSGKGIEQRWFAKVLDDSVNLPGTTDLNGKGFLNADTTTMHLNRVYRYEGAAWYRKKVIIPESQRDKRISLTVERTKTTDVWIDSNYAGSSHILQSPQHFDVTAFLSPGEHNISVRVNNDLKLTPYGNVHIYSDDTQTNWNGILGNICLEATPRTYISDLQVYPDTEKRKISVSLEVVNPLNIKDINIELSVTKTVDGRTTRLKPLKTTVDFSPTIRLEYELGNDCSLWDEYSRPLYQLTATIKNGDEKDSKTVPFGMRKFAASGTQFKINGRTIFLRGKHDAAVFPLTGFPPMDDEGWTRVFRIAKTYGINHYRFHSWCPPEAAFTAADREGIYLQAELPFWGGLDVDSIADMLKAEGFAMLKAYANHPSFVMFSHGNEIWSGHDRVEKNILALKATDNRLLYTMGSNNNVGFVPPRNCSDFFVGARTPFAHDTILTHTRLTQAFCDSRDGGILNTTLPSAMINYSYPVSRMPIPIVSHEIGQYQVYPDFKETMKYNGVLRARNLEVFGNRLKNAGMYELDSAFQKASGAWAAICYKAEMEAALRTDGLAGFQLLDLQDFPGQGTALVGILDAFMDSKNVVSREAWLQSCNDVVLLPQFAKYCWTTGETFRAKVLVANYSNEEISKPVEWNIKDEAGRTIGKGTLDALDLKAGGLTTAGEVECQLSMISKASKLTLNVTIPGTAYSNTYPLWVYPQATAIEPVTGIQITNHLDNNVLDQLQNGGKVLLFPASGDVTQNSLPGLFPPDFWNYGMFKGISENIHKPVSPGTLGILTNPEHPIFNEFPTDFHTNWQWFSILKASNPMILDSLLKTYLPIVQVIDNMERNHKLGLIYEFKEGKGKLLVCMSRLDQLKDKPEAVQLYRSILRYMESDDFKPGYEIDKTLLMNLFK